MKHYILFIFEDRDDHYIMFREIDDGNEIDEDRFNVSFEHRSPTFNRDSTFRVKRYGKWLKGYITTRGLLVVRTYKPYNSK